MEKDLSAQWRKRKTENLSFLLIFDLSVSLYLYKAEKHDQRK